MKTSIDRSKEMGTCATCKLILFLMLLIGIFTSIILIHEYDMKNNAEARYNHSLRISKEHFLLAKLHHVNFKDGEISQRDIDSMQRCRTQLKIRGLLK